MKIIDCGLPSTPPDPEEFRCKLCDESTACTLSLYGVSDDIDVGLLAQHAANHDVVALRDWIRATNWSQTPEGFMGYCNESLDAEKKRVKILTRFMADVISHIEFYGE